MAEAKTKPPATVEEYIAALPAEQRERVEELRQVIRAAAPEAVETISYGMPTLKYQDARVYFAAWKAHCGLYGMDGAALDAERDGLKGYVTEKGTVKFPYAEPLPVALVTRLVKAHIAARKG